MHTKAASPGMKMKFQRAEPKAQNTGSLKLVPLLITFLVGILIWFIPHPAGVQENAWHLLAIFVATIVGFILKPLPMGAMAVLSITLTALTGTLSVTDALSGFSASVIWLIVIAFFISRGFVKTGLGTRIAYLFIRMFGKKTLGLAYSLLATDLILSPAIPSNTARGGGILVPIYNVAGRNVRVASRRWDGPQDWFFSLQGRVSRHCDYFRHVYDLYGRQPVDCHLCETSGSRRY